MEIHKGMKMSRGNTAVSEERKTHTALSHNVFHQTIVAMFVLQDQRYKSLHQDHLLFSFHKPDTL